MGENLEFLVRRLFNRGSWGLLSWRVLSGALGAGGLAGEGYLPELFGTMERILPQRVVTNVQELFRGQLGVRGAVLLVGHGHGVR